jgi:hypothetical protein
MAMISLSGLDLSFLDAKPAKPRAKRKSKRTSARKTKRAARAR